MRPKELLAQRFWQWFVELAPRLSEMNARIAAEARIAPADQAVVEDLAGRLAEFDPRIYPFAGLARDGVNELVLTADGNAAAFPAVFELARTAPVLPGWRIVPLKQRGSVDGSVESDGCSLDCDLLHFFLDHDLSPPALVLLTEEETEADQETYQFLGSMVALQLLGEHDLATEIGALGVVSKARFREAFGHDGTPIAEIGQIFPARPLS